MAKKNKNKNKNRKKKDNQAERRRQQKRGEKNARQGRRGGGASRASATVVPRLPPLDPPDPGRCFPVVFLRQGGQLAEDPREVLGLADDTSEEAINAAWRRKILAHPPERDPEGARRLQEARERLLDPERVIERTLGAVQVPNPEAFGLPPAENPETVDMISPLNRALSQLALYALIEDFIRADADERSERAAGLTT